MWGGIGSKLYISVWSSFSPLLQVDLMFMQMLYSIRDVHKGGIKEEEFSEVSLTQGWHWEEFSEVSLTQHAVITRKAWG